MGFLSEEKGKNTSLEVMGEMPLDMGELLFQLSGMRFALSKIMIEYAPAPDHELSGSGGISFHT